MSTRWARWVTARLVTSTFGLRNAAGRAVHVFNDGFETFGSVVHFAKLKLSLGSEQERHRFTEVVSLNQRRAMKVH